MKEHLSDIIKLLESEGRKVSFLDVADSLWLYSIMRDSIPVTIKNRDENPENNIPKNNNDETSLDNNIEDGEEKNIQKDTSPLYVDNEDKEVTSVSESSNTKIRIPTYKQYNRFNQFARVTKILREFTDSSSEREFDETLTVENIANTNIWDVSTHPKSELKYTLSLIIEKSESMEVWEELIHEFILAMSRFHFFKQVRVFYLKGDNKRYRVYKDKKCKSKVSIKKFYSLKQRNLTILMSDCISIGWGDKRGYKFLNKITKVTPFMILNMLPERMWNRTVLDNTWRVKFTHREGWKNNTLVTSLDEKRYKIKKRKLIRVPITTLEKVPLMYWSNIVAGRKNNWLDGSLFEAEIFEKNIVKNFSKPIEIDAKEIVDSFYVYTSPLAQKLAIYFSITPILNMSIMKMIQKNSLPESNYTHLAEVFLSGLLKKDRVSKESKYKETLYTFRDGVAELLSDRLYTHKKEEIIENNSDFIENNLGYIVDFWARMGEEDKGYSLENSNDNHKFADIEIERENNNSLTIEELKEIISQDENKKLEFKAKWNQDIHELVKNIFSLANGSPKHIDETAYFIIGVDERDKNNFSLKRSDVSDIFSELEKLLKEYSEPKVSNVLIEWYDLAEDNGVLVISIPSQGHLISLKEDLITRKGKIEKKETIFYRDRDSTKIASDYIVQKFIEAYGIIILYKEDDLDIDLLSIVEKLNEICTYLTFKIGKESFKLEDEVVSWSESYKKLNSLIYKEIKWSIGSFFFTKKPYNNNYFFQGNTHYPDLMIVSFSGWNALSTLPYSNAIAYFSAEILSIKLSSYQHQENTGCLYDFSSNKADIDKNMRKAYICESCYNRIEDNKSDKNMKILKDIENILEVVGKASKNDLDILDKLEEELIKDNTLYGDEIAHFTVKIKYGETFGSGLIVKFDEFPNNFFVFTAKHIFINEFTNKERKIDIEEVLIDYDNKKITPKGFISLDSDMIVFIFENSVSSTIHNLEIIPIASNQSIFKESIFVGYSMDSLIGKKCTYSHKLEKENLHQIKISYGYNTNDDIGFSGSGLFIKEKGEYVVEGIIIQYEENISAFNYIKIAPYINEVIEEFLIQSVKNRDNLELDEIGFIDKIISNYKMNIDNDMNNKMKESLEKLKLNEKEDDFYGVIKYKYTIKEIYSYYELSIKYRINKYSNQELYDIVSYDDKRGYYAKKGYTTADLFSFSKICNFKEIIRDKDNEQAYIDAFFSGGFIEVIEPIFDDTDGSHNKMNNVSIWANDLFSWLNSYSNQFIINSKHIDNIKDFFRDLFDEIDEEKNKDISKEDIIKMFDNIKMGLNDKK